MEWIREKVTDTLNKGLREIGAYVFEEFFSSDPKLVSSQNPKKNRNVASFRMLVERCDEELSIKKSTLHRAVAVASMTKQLPADATAFPQLNPSHQAALLPLRAPEKIEKVAKIALSKKMSLRDVETLVMEKKEVLPGKPRGAHKKPTILKMLSRSLKVFELEEGKRALVKAVKALSDDQKKQAVKDAEALAASLKALIEELNAE